jgi:hypothetical protein
MQLPDKTTRSRLVGKYYMYYLTQWRNMALCEAGIARQHHVLNTGITGYRIFVSGLNLNAE